MHNLHWRPNLSRHQSKPSYISCKCVHRCKKFRAIEAIWHLPCKGKDHASQPSCSETQWSIQVLLQPVRKPWVNHYFSHLFIVMTGQREKLAFSNHFRIGPIHPIMLFIFIFFFSKGWEWVLCQPYFWSAHSNQKVGE